MYSAYIASSLTVQTVQSVPHTDKATVNKCAHGFSDTNGKGVVILYTLQRLNECFLHFHTERLYISFGGVS